LIGHQPYFIRGLAEAAGKYREEGVSFFPDFLSGEK